MQTLGSSWPIMPKNICPGIDMNLNSHIPSKVCISPLNHESVEAANLGNVHQRRGQEGTARRGVNDELCQKKNY